MRPPLPSGKRHAGEIAGVALHLLKDIMRFRIPHIPDERITLRIGIHTGSLHLCSVTTVVNIALDNMKYRI